MATGFCLGLSVVVSGCWGQVYVLYCKFTYLQGRRRYQGQECVTATGTLNAAKAWIDRPMHGPRQRTRHTGTAETLVTVMANLRYQDMYVHQMR